MPLPNTAIVHSGLMAKLGSVGYFPSTVVIKEHDGTKDALGSPDLDPANFDPVSGLESLVGRITPARITENPQAGFTVSKATHRLLLSAHYAAITEVMVAVVDSVLYNIDGPPARDGQTTFTRLNLELVTT